MKRQFVVIRTILQNELSALLDSWITNTPSTKMLRPQKIACPYVFLKT
jgi:hypothetical protein